MAIFLPKAYNCGPFDSFLGIFCPRKSCHATWSLGLLQVHIHHESVCCIVKLQLLCSLYVRIYRVIFVPATILPTLLYSILYCKSMKIQKEMALDSAVHRYYHKEWKATITFSLLFVTLFALILPATVILVIVLVLSPGNEYSPVAYTVLVVNLCVFSLVTITDPIVIMRDKNMKEILNKIRNAVSPRRSLSQPKPTVRDL